MPLTPGGRLGSYEVLASLGAGGMGEVYRARDTRLKRDVALKILPESFAADPERLARFRREAEVLASLNHPHIAAIYGLEDSDGTHALVLELVEGETLAERIARGPIPLDDALPIARQICEALEAAHEKGIVHRDLKPANVKVTPDDQVKVLDFGLAKLAQGSGLEARGHDAAVTASPTITSPAMMTGAGIILGTAAYMSPEQAKGREADKRSDIWAFGCVLFELLSGKRAFAGDDMSDVLASVLAREPDWSALPPSVPPLIRALIRRCLEKDRRARVADIAGARFALDEVAGSKAQDPAYGSAGSKTQDPAYVGFAGSKRQDPAYVRRRVAIVGASALLAGAVVATAITWFATRPDAPEPPPVSRLALAPAAPAEVSVNGVDRDLAITPDGSRVIYLGNRGTQIFVRALDALAPRAVFSGAGPRGVFVSPDGQWIGFIDGSILKKVAVSGGPSVTLATLDGTSRGATWGADDSIVVSTPNTTTGLQQVASGGGPPRVLTRPDRTQGEADHLWPEMLPGRAVLFTITPVTGGLNAAQVAVLDLETGTRTVLVRGGSHAHYVPEGPASPARTGGGGHLVYQASGTLWAVAFDLATRTTRGTPVPVVEEVATTINGGMDAVVAGNGTLVYVTAGVLTLQRTLVWVDRQGRETSIPAPPRAYVYPRLSPDGSRIAVYAQDQESDIWVWDTGRTTLTRATLDPAGDIYPVWPPDGRRLLFSSDRAGARNLFTQTADGTGAVARLTDNPNVQNATAVTPDGSHMIFTETVPKTGEDILQIDLDGTSAAAGSGRAAPVEPRRVTPLVQSSFAERNGIVSPDGRWLAYEANDSGRFEIYVRPYPEVNSGHWQVSTTGGARPLWARNGQELFYLSPTGAIMRVGVERGTSWAATTPSQLIKEGYFTIPGGNPGRTYDVSPDGQRFLLIKEGSAGDQSAASPQIIVVQHFDEELKRLVPSK